MYSAQHVVLNGLSKHTKLDTALHELREIAVTITGLIEPEKRICCKYSSSVLASIVLRLLSELHVVLITVKMPTQADAWCMLCYSTM
jgi:DeoR/GlpR family transcriptional regulator of sugar metabolism